MSRAAVAALQAESDRAAELFRSLSPDEWAAPSGCVGWRVQDVACHMASVFHSIADPATIEGGSSHDVEENAEVPVQSRRAWSVDQVMAEYAEWAGKGIDALAGLQEPPMHDTVIPLANLGSHPMHILANAIVFDHYCHLRHDIGAAVPRAAALPQDDAALSATLEWMLAGIPQMCEGALASCSQGVNLAFVGPAAGAWALRPGADGGRWTVEPGPDAALPTATGSAHSFVSWATKRADWRISGVLLGGPNADGAAVTLDALNVI
jgi:uncharacterized protein (TIGR03083 family)